MILIQEFKDCTTSDKFIKRYREINEFCLTIGIPAPNDLDVFCSLGSTEQMAVLSYRLGVNSSASAKVARKKWIGYQDNDGNIFLRKHRSDTNAIAQMGQFLFSDPYVQNMEVTQSFEVGRFTAVKMMDIYVFFDS